MREALGSVIAQPCPNWVAIVVDDASAIEGLDAVVASFADPRMIVIRHDVNRGLAAARNSGIRDSGTDWVLLLDADDRLEPEFLARTMSTMKESPETDCVLTHWQLFGGQTAIRRHEVKDLAALTHDQWLPGPGVLLNRRIWEATSGYCEAPELRSGNEDWDFWLAAAAHGLRVQVVPEVLYNYRIHAGSMTNTSLSYFGNVSWNFVHSRHRSFFKTHSGGRRFVATGYLRAASASLNRRNFVRAMRMGIAALYFSPQFVITTLWSYRTKAQ